MKTHCCSNQRRFRHRVTVQKRTRGTNASGEVTESWEVHATAWADVEPLTAREMVGGTRQTIAEVAYRITTHSTSLARGITPQMRVLYDGRVLEIGGAYDEGERREFVKLLCTERIEGQGQ